MSELNLYQRIAAAMEACSYVKKDTQVKGYGGGYTAVSHDAVTAKVRTALLAHGVIAPFSVVESSETKEELHSTDRDGKAKVRTVFRCSVVGLTRLINVDQPEEVLEVRSFGTGEDSGDKASGKAVSYAAKYALLKALMLETGDDADKDASIQRQAAPVDPARERATNLYNQIKASGDYQSLIDPICAEHKSAGPQAVYDALCKFAAANGIEVE
jgi:hypothetical protein